MKTQSQEMQAALNRLQVEYIHFANTGIGKKFLFDAIENLLQVDANEFNDALPKPVNDGGDSVC